MATIRIQGTDLNYEESDIIRFEEGLIGMPHLRRMVLINYSEVAPFFVLCSLDDQLVNFLVLDAETHFPDYTPVLPKELCAQLGLAGDDAPLILVTATIAPEWMNSTINLRAPIVVGPKAMKGAQIILADASYRMAEPLPVTWVVAAA